MMAKADVNQIGSFLYQNGFFAWNQSRIFKEYDNDYIVTIPTIENDSVSSVMFVGLVSDSYTYWHITLEELKKPTTELIEKYGAKNLVLGIFEMINYENRIGNYENTVLLKHFNNSILSDEVLEIHPRGWCLIEVVLTSWDQGYDYGDEEPNNRVYYNTLMNTVIFNIPADFNPETDDPDWKAGNPFQKHKWKIKGDKKETKTNGGIIHGQETNDGETVYYFWAWCADDVSQDPWTYNWSTNTTGTGGNGNNDDGPNWDYDKPRWTEDTKQCMFAFDDPHGTQMINNLEEELLAASCGDASEYNVKQTIDNIILDLCEEYYENQGDSEGGPSFPSDPGHDTEETLSTITNQVESNETYQIGIEICEVCEESLHPISCYNDFNTCPPADYVLCVEEKICDRALSNFSVEYNLNLSQGEKDAINATISTCGDPGFEDDVKDMLIDDLNLNLSSELSNYVKTNFNIYVELETFLGKHLVSESSTALSQSIAKAYVQILKDENLSSLELDLGNVGNFNDPYWNIAKDFVLESLKELLIDAIPGASLATIGPEVLNNLQNGQWMDAIYNATEIILNEADLIFPAAKVLSFSLGLVVTGKQLKKVFQAFKKAKNLGEDFLLKFYNVFRNKMNWGISTIRDKFGWLGGLNAKIDDYAGGQFFDLAKEEFGGTFAFSGKNGHPVFKILNIPINKSIYMELYPDSDSDWNWTIEFSTAPENATNYTELKSKYKIRFDN